MKKFSAIFGLIGAGLMILLNIIDHIANRGINSDTFYILLMLSIALMAPMLIREALVIRDEIRKKGGKD